MLEPERALQEFSRLASAFCGALENEHALLAEARLAAIHRLLPQLYSAALELPKPSPLTNDAALDSDTREPPFEPPPNLDSLADFLNQHRHYREVVNPYADPVEAEVTGDLIDDFRDIYRDLQRGLRLWQSGQVNAAHREWRSNFEIHTAEHLTSALRALFARCAFEDFPWPVLR